MQKEIAEWFRQLQNNICLELEKADTQGRFQEDNWVRPGGGGGKTRIFRNGLIIEKGGVNFSEVFGPATDFLRKQFNENAESFFATGISIVIHPRNPAVPIIHMNTRYLEIGNKSWFGGGIDLTPHYIDLKDARFFHSAVKNMCDKFDPSFYPLYKKQADDYFFIPHRNETRGIGGIFFDQLEDTKTFSKEDIFRFVKTTGELFAPVYVELMKRNADKIFSEREINWQRLRRGRYVEFNLVYDKGTKFGLETNGRTESILMSLPPRADWEYDYKPEPGSQEAYTLSLLKKGVDWISE